MTFEEAMKIAEDGGRVRLPTWESGRAATYAETGNYAPVELCTVEDGEYTPWSASAEERAAKDWERA